MKRIRWASLTLIVGCSGSAPTPPAIPDWAVASTPSLTIGAAEADPGHELSRVSGARMQGDRVIVANSGTNEIQRFDSPGGFLGVEGRKGHGPGEFIGILTLSTAPGDSLYILDSENLRWSVHDGAGRYGRTLPGGASALARPTWAYHRVMVRSTAGAPVPAWALALLDSLPEPPQGSPARQARFDDLGFLWLQDSASSSAWTVHASAGAAVGRVSGPTVGWPASAEPRVDGGGPVSAGSERRLVLPSVRFSLHIL